MTAQPMTLKTQIENCKLKIENLRLILHSRNMGKGTAIKTGLKAMTGDAVIVQDADLEYDPADIQLLLNELGNRTDLVVYGSRNLKPERRGYSHYVIGSKILDFLVNLFFWHKINRCLYLLQTFSGRNNKKINIESTGFELEMELTVKTLKWVIKLKKCLFTTTHGNLTKGKNKSPRRAQRYLGTFKI